MQNYENSKVWFKAFYVVIFVPSKTNKYSHKITTMKIKTLFFGLLIAGATAMSYVTVQDQPNANQASKEVLKSAIKVPTRG